MKVEKNYFTLVDPDNPKSIYRFQPLGPDGAGQEVGYLNGLYCTKEVMEDWYVMLRQKGYVRLPNIDE